MVRARQRAVQLTLTTHPAGGKGYEFYVDGAPVGATFSNGTYVGAQSLLASTASIQCHDALRGFTRS